MPKPKIRIRLADETDESALFDLLHRCPIDGSMRLLLDRRPSFMGLSRLQGERSRVFVAEGAGGALLGSAMFTEREELWGEQRCRVLRFSDLRTDPDTRAQKVAAALIGLYATLLRDEGFDYGRVEILEGNEAPRRAHHLVEGRLTTDERGRADIYQLFPLWTWRIPRRFVIRRATQDDLGALAGFLDRSLGDRLGHPDFERTALIEALSKDPSFSIGTFWLAFDPRGRLVAAVSAWDQFALRQTIVLRFARSARSFIRLLRLIGLLWALPPIPVEGKALRYLYLRWLACDPSEPMALRYLVRHVMNQVRKDKSCHFLSVAFHEGDSLQSCLKGIVRFRTRMHIVFHWVRWGQREAGISRRPGFTFIDPVLL